MDKGPNMSTSTQRKNLTHLLARSDEEIGEVFSIIFEKYKVRYTTSLYGDRGAALRELLRTYAAPLEESTTETPGEFSRSALGFLSKAQQEAVAEALGIALVETPEEIGYAAAEKVFGYALLQNDLSVKAIRAAVAAALDAERKRAPK